MRLPERASAAKRPAPDAVAPPPPPVPAAPPPSAAAQLDAGAIDMDLAPDAGGLELDTGFAMPDESALAPPPTSIAAERIATVPVFR